MSRRMGLLGGGGGISPTLNNNSWDVISAVSSAGEAANFWSVGDCKEIVLNGTVGKLTLSNYTVCVFIIGFDHNSTYEGANRIHFQLGKTALSGGTDVALCDSSYGSSVSATGYFSMNISNISTGGWESSQMRTNICGTSLTNYSGTIIAVIPEALRAVLKSVTKYTNNTGNTSSLTAVTETTDYFFLLSEYEVFGSLKYANDNEASYQAQYAYYSAGNSKIKYNHSATSTAVTWWLRSPRVGFSTSFVYVVTGGTVGGNGVSHSSRGFAPGFCV